LPRGIRWNISSTLEDLDFADDLALLSQTHHHLQEKTNRISNFVNQAVATTKWQQAFSIHLCLNCKLNKTRIS
jgi:hypothetical protein